MVYYSFPEDGTIERIVLKKLAHDWEIRRLDERMCQLAKQPDSCRPGHFAKGVVNQYRVKGELDRSISLNKLKSTVRLDTEV